MKLAFVIAIATLILSACSGTVVYRQNGVTKNQQEYEADELTCVREARREFPYAQGITTTPGTPGTTVCDTWRGSTTCNTVGGSSATVQSFDANERQRNRYYNTCFDSKGWDVEYVEKQQQQVTVRSIRDRSGTADDSSDSEKFVVELGGYCTQTDHCAGGLNCIDNKCSTGSAKRLKSTRVIPPKPAVGSPCEGNQDCGKGTICSSNSCVVDFAKTR